MYFLVAGSLLFFAVHFYSAFRSRVPGTDIREKMGSARFMATYSLISLIGFVLMVWGYGLARPSEILFNPPSWGAMITMVLMLPTFILLVASYAPRGYIKQYVKHPMLLATILWSFGHLLSNGEVNSAILFGGFLAFSLIDRLSVMNRMQPIKKVSYIGDVVSIAFGVVLYAVTLVFLHSRFIGVPILT